MHPPGRWQASRQTVLFYTPETEPLARRIAAQEGFDIELAHISWDKFQDGFPNLFVRDAPRMRDRHVAFLASFHSPGVIFEQLSIIYALPKMFVASFTLVLPFFPTGTAERVEFEGEIATAFTLARILSHVPLCRGGPCDLVIFDIHALQERFYFGDNVAPLFCSGVPLLLRELRTLPDGMNVAIAYPDEGAWKRFHWQFESFPEIICTKVRDGDKRIVRLKEGAPAGRHVVIVDDLVQSGGTLVECARALKAAGAAQVSAYVTHGVFPGRSWERFLAPTPEAAAAAGADDSSAAVFTHFWMTDSCPPTVRAVEGKAPFKILSLARPIAEALCY